MSRDLSIHLSNKLSGEWSAASAAGMLSEPIIEYLVGRWADLDAGVRSRLLLSPLFLRRADLEELRPALAQLAAAGAADRWVGRSGGCGGGWAPPRRAARAPRQLTVEARWLELPSLSPSFTAWPLPLSQG